VGVLLSPILVIAPHGLDEVLGCGGTMALSSNAGRNVHVLILCGNGSGKDGQRREAAVRAAALLGAEAPRFAGYPENQSDTVGLGKFIDAVERTVVELRPGAVYVTHGGNLNIDHKTAFRAAATALRPLPGSPVSHFYSYEIPSSTDWAPPGFGAPFQPNRFIDISSVLDRKLQALNHYAFDMRPEPHARSNSAVRNLACRRGASVGLAAAEAFVLLREIEKS
jgi:LmbE family N-acetylglucosaminyl deacetylase